MKRTLGYGQDQSLELDLDPAVMLGDFSRPRGTPHRDPLDAAWAAFQEPVEFPPLQQAVIPGDHVVIALEEGLPQRPALVAAAVRSLVAGGVVPGDITVLLAAATGDDVPEQLLRRLEPGEQALRIARHDPQDSEALAYLAASKENRPIYFNRQLFDADLVVPIGCARPRASLGYGGTCGSLFPGFSDAATIGRFRAPQSAESAVTHQLHCQEAEEAAWLLGIQFAVEVIPGLGEQLLHVVAGQIDKLARRGRPLCDAAWLHRLPARPQLVIASISGGPEQQTWENFGRALFAALSVVADGGAVALCTGLSGPPGPSLQRLVDLADESRALREIRRDRSPDAASAAMLLESRDRAELFLLSDLDGETVEELGLGYIRDPDELGRLSKHYESCVLLGDAHRGMLELRERQE